MGSEDPKVPLRRNGFSFDSLTGLFGLSGARSAAIALDFAEGTDPLEVDDEAPSMRGLSESQFSKDDLDNSLAPKRRISAPALPYPHSHAKPEVNDGKKDSRPSTTEDLYNKNEGLRRASVGDKTRGHNTPAKSGFILNWLAYQPMACEVIQEANEVTTPPPSFDSAMPPLTAPNTTVGSTSTSRPITEAVLKMDPSVVAPKEPPKRKTSLLRDMNALTPSNWWLLQELQAVWRSYHYQWLSKDPVCAGSA